MVTKEKYLSLPEIEPQPSNPFTELSQMHINI